MQVCTSLQTDNHASTPPLSFFTGWMPYLPPNQQRQSTESTNTQEYYKTSILQPLYMSICFSWHPQLKNGRFCWSKDYCPNVIANGNYCIWIKEKTGKQKLFLN